ncbi:unnamed protein product [Paramecium pentaurelia]|uniref:Protein kinase domain-containing protein n=1 Tax=Paramecium pentaurelia TaxID=43138 RepID=A0A8S1UFX7_9CILI|nr:unnamed protein product [Paramecium pentaurelia]
MQIKFMPITLNNYILNQNEPLGSGLSSMVFKAKNIDTNNYVALKIIKKSNSDINLSEQKISQMYKLEVEVLTQCNKLKNQNIVRLIQNFESSDKYALVLELCDYSLQDYLKQFILIKEEQALDIFLQIYNGLSCLQNYKYYHRDIKPSNIMFKDNQIKIIDFGFCLQTNSFENQKLNTRCGTRGYQAPEVREGNYDPEKSDIYSLGVVFYEILYGLQNFTNKNNFIYPLKIQVSEMTKALIDMMVQEDYKNRISWQQIGEILKAIKSTFKTEQNQQFQLDEDLRQKFFIFKKILQEFKKIREEHKDFLSLHLELLLIKKMISDYEKSKLNFDQQKGELEKKLKLLQESYDYNILELKILQNYSLRTKLNKLINDLEKERCRSLHENKELKLKLCNDYFIKHFNHLNEELFNEQSNNFKNHLEREINQVFSILQKPEYVTSDNSLQIKVLKINILVIKYSEDNFEKIKDQLQKLQLISNKQLSMIEILDSIKNESMADQFKQCLDSLD